MRRKLLLLQLVLAALVLSACTLLPPEEEVRTAPLLREYQSQTYTMTAVQRGDLIQTERVSCSYVPLKTQNLSFQLVGEYVDKMTVSTGDYVEAGQLLGQLEISDYEEQIAAVERKLEELEIRAAHVEASYELALRRYEAESSGRTMEQNALALEAVEQDFANRRRAIEEEQLLQRLTGDHYRKMLSERQIFAPFDGVITYVRGYKDGAVTGIGENAVTIVDSSLSLFRASTKRWNCFAPGDEFDIEVNKQIYHITVAAEESLGLPLQQKTAGEKAYVYFVLSSPAMELEEGDYGSLEIVVDQRLNALYLPEAAISQAAGRSLVYYLREDGMRAFKEIETGVTIGGRTEILSGLEEGESIILE